MTFSGHKLTRAWHSRGFNLALWAAAVVMMTAPGMARAQSYGGGGGAFSGLGQNLLSLICNFTQSPIVTVVVAVALVACFVVASLNEDRGTLSSILRTVGYGLAIVMLPRLMTMIGFTWGSCT